MFAITAQKSLPISEYTVTVRVYAPLGNFCPSWRPLTSTRPR